MTTGGGGGRLTGSSVFTLTDVQRQRGGGGRTTCFIRLAFNAETPSLIILTSGAPRSIDQSRIVVHTPPPLAVFEFSNICGRRRDEDSNVSPELEWSTRGPKSARRRCSFVVDR